MMRMALVAAAAAALVAVPGAAAATETTASPKYGTENCYVVVNPPPTITISTQWPFVHVDRGPDLLEEVHCPTVPR